MRYHCACANSVFKALTMCAVEKLPVKEMGGYKLGGHVLQCLVTDIIPIKLQLPGRSRLIFEFYSVTALRAHMRLQSTLHTCKNSQHRIHRR